MIADLTTLRALKARVDAATGADRELDAMLVIHFDIRPQWLENMPGELWVRQTRRGPEVAFRHSFVKERDAGNTPAWSPEDLPRFTASIDAAVGLVERLKPRADDVLHARLSFDGEGCAAMIEHADQDPWHAWVSGANLSLAIVGALLTALIAQAEAGAEESAAAATDGGER